MPNSRNVMANMKAFAELQRNAFDLRNGHIYSQKCGEIIPIKAVHTIPGDYFDCKVTDQNLSFPMNTAAFMGARKEITTYFVPYNHVYSLYNQLQATRPDPKTSALTESDRVEEARMSLLGLYFPLLWQFWAYASYEYWIPMRVRQVYDDEFGSYDEACYENSLSQARNDFLNTVSFDTYLFTVASIPFSVKRYLNDSQVISSSVDFQYFGYVNSFDLLPFQGSQEIVSASNYYPINDGSSVVRPLRSYCLDIVGRFRIYSWIRKLDMLDYVNLYPIFRSAEKFFMEHTDIQEYFQRGYSQDVFSFLCQNILRLSLSNYYAPHEYPDNYTPQFQYVNLYAILAYNKVFYDYFRNTYYDLRYCSRNYNIDFSIRQDFYLPIIHPEDLDIRFLDIEYHQWKKDIITGVLPNAQYGAVSGITIDVNRVDLTGARVVGNTGTDSGRWFTDNGAPWSPGTSVVTDTDSTKQNLSASNGILHNHHLDIDVDVSHAQLTLVDAFDVLQLKRAEMLQAYRQMLMRNGNRTIDIFKGLYGDAPASEDDNSPRFVDAFGSTLFVDTVVSTAETAQQGSTKGALGDLGARAVINGGGNFKFKTSDFGVLIFLGYIVPDAVYPSFGLSPANRALDPESHFIPFFQNLGFTPVLNSDFNKFYRQAGVELETRGFAPSYYDKKTDIDRAHGNFVALPKENMVVSFTTIFDGVGQLAIDDFVGSFNHWTPLRIDAVASQKPTLQLLYISPSYWDNVFVQKAGADYDSDHFVVNTRIFIDSVRKLSKLGLPNF